MANPASHIGTLREKPLHRSLKEWYSEPGDLVEQPLDGYVIDLVRGDLLIEIQTGSFSKMRNKLQTLLGESHRVRIVFPVAAEKWLVKVTDDGEIINRRKSPKRSAVTDVFAELVSFPALVVDSALEIEVLLTREEEYRHHTPDKSWRRKGWSVLERRLVEVVDRTLISDGASLVALLPAGLPDPFTTADLSASLEIQRRLAQQMAYCLREASVIDLVGKIGTAHAYSIPAT